MPARTSARRPLSSPPKSVKVEDHRVALTARIRRTATGTASPHVRADSRRLRQAQRVVEDLSSDGECREQRLPTSRVTPGAVVGDACVRIDISLTRPLVHSMITAAAARAVGPEFNAHRLLTCPLACRAGGGLGPTWGLPFTERELRVTSGSSGADRPTSNLLITPNPSPSQSRW
jgi:hypothetical protein